jgi:hypothetical protein
VDSKTRKTTFLVDDEGSLELAAYSAPQTNAEAYSLPVLSFAELVEAMENCQPLRSAIEARAAIVVPELEDCGDTGELADWIEGTSKRERAELLEHVREWLAAAPDWDCREHFRIPADAREAAFEHLNSRDRDDLANLSVELVDGEMPGNDIRYARLRMGVDAANLLALSLELPYRFEKSP